MISESVNSPPSMFSWNSSATTGNKPELKIHKRPQRAYLPLPLLFKQKGKITENTLVEKMQILLSEAVDIIQSSARILKQH